ncbi:protocadherin-7-like [Silurus meridionalis]|nr:protocadherin-7-like [Silurus meridionalis]
MGTLRILEILGTLRLLMIVGTLRILGIMGTLRILEILGTLRLLGIVGTLEILGTLRILGIVGTLRILGILGTLRIASVSEKQSYGQTQASPRRLQGNGAPRQRMASFTSAGDDNNNHDNSDREEDEGEEDDGSDQGSGGGGADDTRSPLANGDPLTGRRRGDRNRNIGDHNRNLLNRKMTSASYDTFISPRFGGQCHADDSDVPPQHEVIPLTRAGGGDFKTTSCLTLPRREVYL